MIETQPEAGQSRLTLLKSGLKDGDQLTCSVTNAATQLHHDPHQRNLTTQVTIRVHSKFVLCPIPVIYVLGSVFG